MYIDPGDLDKRIQIVQIMTGKSYDRQGHPIREEKVIRTCWAKVTSTSGTELIRANIELADAKKRFLVRWTTAKITEAMVVRYRGEDHNIVYVNPYSDDRRYTEIWTDKKKAVT